MHDVEMPPPGAPAALYIRESDKLQALGQSPEMQRTALLEIAARQGYPIALDLEEHESSSKPVKHRPKYLRILEAARDGRVKVILVFTLSRWGRNAGERIIRGDELDRKGVVVYSAQQGIDRAGITRGIYAIVDEQYARDLSAWVTPARRQAARKGTHMGSTPFGFKRVYPAYEGGPDAQRRPAGELVADPATLWVVRELFQRYAGGGWSFRTLATWLNSDAAIPRNRRARPWTAEAARYILHNPVYAGFVRYDTLGVGIYQRAAPGGAFVVRGRHHEERIVEEEVYQRVQERILRATKRPVLNRLDPDTLLASGLLVCETCGAALIQSRRRDKRRNPSDRYVCSSYNAGRAATHDGPTGVMAPVAHAALLDQLRRLEGLPWITLPADATAADRTADKRRHVEEALRGVAQKMTNATAVRLQQGPTASPFQQAAFDAASADLERQDASLRAQLTTLQDQERAVPQLRAIHTVVCALPAYIERAELLDMPHVLRDPARLAIASARVVRRVPAGGEARTVWARLEVTWTAGILELERTGRLRIADPPAPPTLLTEAERNHAKYIRLRDRRRAASTRVNVPAE